MFPYKNASDTSVSQLFQVCQVILPFLRWIAATWFRHGSQARWRRRTKWVTSASPISDPRLNSLLPSSEHLFKTMLSKVGGSSVSPAPARYTEQVVISELKWEDGKCYTWFILTLHNFPKAKKTSNKNLFYFWHCFLVEFLSPFILYYLFVSGF